MHSYVWEKQTYVKNKKYSDPIWAYYSNAVWPIPVPVLYETSRYIDLVLKKTTLHILF